VPDPWPAPPTEFEYVSSLPHTAAVATTALFAIGTWLLFAGTFFEYSKAPF